MVNYQLGKIYKLVSPHTDKVYIGSTAQKYLSTRLEGHKGHYNHWKNGKGGKCMSFDLLELGDVDIVLVETYPCNNCDELRMRERYWQDYFEEQKINKLKAYISPEEVKQKNKENREKNKEKLTEKHKQYYEENKERLQEQHKQYREEHKEQIKEKHKQYYEENKDKVKKQIKQYREENKEHLNDCRNRWYEKNKEKLTEYKKQWHQNNKERLQEERKQYFEEYRKNNREKRKEKFTCLCGSISTISHKLRHFRTDKHQNFINGVRQAPAKMKDVELGGPNLIFID